MSVLEGDSSTEFDSHIRGCFPHVVEQSYHLIMASLTGVCSSFRFAFTSTYTYLVLPEEEHIFALWVFKVHELYACIK